ncbi:MAG: thioredoxin domain-containing protein [Myxococcales bacterium]|nr:thioredoxin domain-containing protein [Myxococcales bacterium]
MPTPLPGAEPLPAELSKRLAETLASLGPDYVPRSRHLSADGKPRFTNRLLLEASPYLRQHAHNPVNWYPWGDEAFEFARANQRPVLLSIGYSTCHWCHVMEEESFDDVETARLLNEHFVAVKVDREARPDIDAIYMGAVHAMGESGGWPLNVWLTPDRQAFFGGTYFPPSEGRGRPAFRRVLRTIHEQYREAPERLHEQASRVSEAVRGELSAGAAGASFSPGVEVLETAAAQATSRADTRWGGMRQRVKFPSSIPVPFLLRWQRRSGDSEALAVVTRSLEGMAQGGIRDHLGGGFHRYSTDERWLVPHFEKMLYDQALIANAYLEAWQATGREDFAAVTREILDYLIRDMQAPQGAFYSATDADSAGPDGEPEEGRFFTWSPTEVDALLGPEHGALVRAWYGISEAGDYEGRSVLHTWESMDAVAKRFELAPKEMQARVEEGRRRLLASRGERPAPLRDDKLLVAWNGLAISAFARAGFAFDSDAYVAAARRAADFVLREMRVDGRLRRVWLQGQASGPAFLSDYAFLIAGLLDLYQADPDPRWLREALALQAYLDAHYAAPGGGYYRVAKEGESLLARERPARDGALPSGNSVAALSLLRMAAFTGQERYHEQALALLSALNEQLTRAPINVSELLLALDFALDTPKEILVVLGAEDDGDALLGVLRTAHVPNAVISVVREGDQLDAQVPLVPLLRYKKARDGKATAYVCENRVCRRPTSDPTLFASQLAPAPRDVAQESPGE